MTRRVSLTSVGWVVWLIASVVGAQPTSPGPSPEPGRRPASVDAGVPSADGSVADTVSDEDADSVADSVEPASEGPLPEESPSEPGSTVEESSPTGLAGTSELTTAPETTPRSDQEAEVSPGFADPSAAAPVASTTAEPPAPGSWSAPPSSWTAPRMPWLSERFWTAPSGEVNRPADADGEDAAPKDGPLRVPGGAGPAMEAWVPGIPEWAHGTVGSALLILLVLLVLAVALQWLRSHLPKAGVLPALVRTLEVGLRLCIFLAVLLVGARLLWGVAGGAYKWILVASALGAGWSVRDVLPDLAAAVVLRFEGRVRPGVWVTSDGFEGVVERRALRAVWLRDPSGDRVAVPNRRMVASILRIQHGMGALHDVPIRLASNVTAAEARSAILEAVVTSPYVAPDVRAAVRRDGATPDLWHVRASLLDERYARAFEGELLERVEAVLDAMRA